MKDKLNSDLVGWAIGSRDIGGYLRSEPLPAAVLVEPTVYGFAVRRIEAGDRSLVDLVELGERASWALVAENADPYDMGFEPEWDDPERLSVEAERYAEDAWLRYAEYNPDPYDLGWEA